MKDTAGGTDNGTMEMGLKSAKSGSDPQIRGRIQELIRGDLAKGNLEEFVLHCIVTPGKPFYRRTFQ